MSTEETTAPSKPAPATRDSIRSAIFSAKPVKASVEVFGTTVEVRQMSTGAITALRTADDQQNAMLRSIVGHCFVPGTNETLFDETDLAALADVPFSEDMITLSTAIGKLSGLDLKIEEEEKNSD